MAETPKPVDRSDSLVEGMRIPDLLDHIPATIFILTNEVQPSLLYINRQVERLTGSSVQEWMTDPHLWFRSMHPGDRERVGELWNAAIENGSTFDAEFRIVRPDGGIVWVREVNDPVLDGDGAIVCRQGFALDVTDRLAAEEALTRSEARYRALVERLPAVVYVDSDEPRPRSLYVSPNSEEVLGYAPARYLQDEGLWLRVIHPDYRTMVESAWADAVARKAPFHAEYRVLRPAGGSVWIRDSSIPIVDEEGSTLFWQGVILDITAQKEAEQELHRAESRFRVLVEQVPAVVYEMGPDDERRATFVSPHVEAILGYSREEWLDQPDIWSELLHPDDREIELAAHDSHTRTGEPWRREYRLIANDGREVWVRDQAVLVREPVSRAPTWQGVMLDITPEKQAEQGLREAKDDLEWRVLARTAELEEAAEMMSLEIGERKRVEAELRETEHRYRQLIEDLPAAVYSWDATWEDGHAAPSEGRATYMSPQIEAILGFTPAEWTQPLFWRERLHPHDVERIAELSHRCLLSGEPFTAEFRYLHRDGSVVWVLDRATLRSRDAQGRPLSFQGVLVDITARKEAESKAEEAEVWYRRLTEKNPGITWIVSGRDPDPTVRWRHYHVSPRSFEQMGYPPEAFSAPPQGWFAFLHPDDRERVIEETYHVWRTGDPWSSDFRMIHADGRVIWFHMEGLAVEMDQDGLPTSYQGVILDIDDRKREEEQIRTAELKSRGLLDGMPAIPWTEVIDSGSGQSRYLHIGPQCEEILGYTADELMTEARHLARMLHPDDRERALAATDRSDRTGEPWDLVFRVIRRDGEVRWLHGVARVTSDPDDPMKTWQGVTIDVTAQMAQSDGAPEPAREGMDAASSASSPSRPDAGGSPTAR